MPLIVFEGIDGSGTTTHSKRLAKQFEEIGRPVIWTCEPTNDSPIGVLVRDFFEGRFGELPNWRAMLSLFQADREMHYVRIEQWLQDGKYVVSDRNWLSGNAYQAASAEMDEGRGREAEKLLELMNEHAPTPDITFILDVSVDEALRRLNKSPDHYEKKEFLESVRARYKTVRGPRLYRVSTEAQDINTTFAEIDQIVRENGF